MKNKLVLMVALFTFSGLLHASAQINTSVKELKIWHDGIATVVLEGGYLAYTGTNCGNPGVKYAIDTNQAGGKAIYSMVLEAKILGLPIKEVGGLNTCNSSKSGYENIQSVKIDN